ncbi:hypothetical protein LTR10_018237 [Elasticomyces elasticus]|uniref:SnoaL-like domain-containing protein n=1 Tax=Exophiala sideris TaxID=1016849 RepID=A0ABR0JIU6_9EURO|nr:hypothetical protein LTR10_018237 [Elasticomyces elasticus]KAK5034522.1 hypothetical protein LTS07_003443 [Exophiala sideris]KAK5042818.1 hypothetical protein LTR13_001666 [Exophiala sideris]KAK5065901.1 hypothetical protein LTR69_003451 [Exophiala sideris]KAK5185637.1 hypothetical protein LTR44_001686 [Eurotiomycetes sp. CCFEE 6388]
MSKDQSLEAVQKRLCILEDKDELTTLMNKYCTVSDTFDFKGYGDCYHKDGTLEYDRFHKVTGKDRLAEKARSALEGYEGLQHSMTNMQFEVNGDKATGTANLICMATPNLSKPGVNFMFGGPYRWDFVRTEDGWRLWICRLSVVWTLGEDTIGGFSDKDK